MITGYRGTFVISWSQTETDGVRAAPAADLVVGATWRWRGEPVRIDGPNHVMVLDKSIETTDIRKRAARTVRRLVGAALDPQGKSDPPETDNDLNIGFVVTDGRRTYPVTLVPVRPESRPLLMFSGEAPPRDRELWVVATMLEADHTPHHRDHGAGVICFTEGTMIAAEGGDRPVEDIRPGDRILTMDDGPQDIVWIGRRRMSGARLFAMPELRPIRIRAGALMNDRPEADLLVSPQHRVLVKGGAAEVLFNTPEVLVAAGDLLNDNSILVDYSVREVTYIHLMTERHQVVWANGVATESFHPANTLLQTIEEEARNLLFEMRPELQDDAHAYGDYARRNLSRSEAAILAHGGY